jgi:site-specific DNA-cytosine methylase
MENVVHSCVLSVVKRKQSQHNQAFSYAIINFEKLGVPQSRIRLIAGSYELVAKLLTATEHGPRRTIRSVIPSPRGTHIRGGATGLRKRKKARASAGEAQYTRRRASWTDMCRTLDMPAPTVVGRHALTWITGNGEKCNRSVLYPKELAALQTFPVGYKLPQNKFFAYLQIGNALPPLVAQIMLTNRCKEPR